jgi:hypothetical protein
MKIPRGTFLHLLAGAASPPALSRIATAQTYPTRQIPTVVPFAACGGLMAPNWPPGFFGIGRRDGDRRHESNPRFGRDYSCEQAMHRDGEIRICAMVVDN